MASVRRETRREAGPHPRVAFPAAPGPHLPQTGLEMDLPRLGFLGASTFVLVILTTSPR